MRGFVANTDYEWYRFLSGRPDLDEVNFWRPGGEQEFRRLDRGQPILFRLKRGFPLRRALMSGGSDTLGAR